MASTWNATVPGDRIDWKDIRDRIDLAAVVTALLDRPRSVRRPPPALVAMPVPRGPVIRLSRSTPSEDRGSAGPATWERRCPELVMQR